VVFVLVPPFSRSAEFEDRYGLLQGKGKNTDALRYYIRQALEFDAK
jgi:hypothetical protein